MGHANIQRPLALLIPSSPFIPLLPSPFKGVPFALLATSTTEQPEWPVPRDKEAQFRKTILAILSASSCRSVRRAKPLSLSRDRFVGGHPC